MACLFPRDVYRSTEVNPSGKRSIVFDSKKGYGDLTFKIACKQCNACRQTYSLDWATRVHLEQSLYEANCFVTLTYDAEHYPPNGGLVRRDHQLFMKSLRDYFYPRTIRYYAAGEYGESSLRPHFHSCLFNIDFDDKVLWKSQHGEMLYTSPTLAGLWKNGRAVIGSLTFASAAYVARYILKKVRGRDADEHYQVEDMETGEWVQVERERALMSLRPGVGIPWLEKFKSDVYPSDFITINNKRVRPPAAFDVWLSQNDPQLWQRVKYKRMVSADRHAENNTIERLRVRRELTDLKLQFYRRIYEV